MARRKGEVPVRENDVIVKGSEWRIKYAPRGASLAAFTDHSDELLLAGPAGTGKSLGLLQKVHLCLSKYKNAKAAIARKTRQSMTNSCIDMFERHVLKPPDKVYFHKTDQQFNYPNGSMMAVIGLDEPTRIMSTEFDLIYIQEATECTEKDWEMATTRLRSGIMPYQQLLGDCNPDKPTHWLKKRVDKGLTKMLLSVHEDNPRLYHPKYGWTAEGKKYLAKLDRLTGARRSRLKLGQWVAAEGVVYEKWDPQVHMVSLKDLPQDWQTWPHYWSHDFGFTHPFVWQDWIENPYTGQIYLLRQIYRTKRLVEDHARYIMKLTGPDAPVGYQCIPRAILCDHDAEDRATLHRHTEYPNFPAYKAIQAGIQAVQARLEPDWCNEGPGLFIVRDSLVEKDNDLVDAGLPTCTEEEFDGYVWDEKISRLVNSKKDELPVDKDNHGMDALRYMVAFHDSLADDPEDTEGVIMLGEDSRVTIAPC